MTELPRLAQGTVYLNKLGKRVIVRYVDGAGFYGITDDTDGIAKGYAYELDGSVFAVEDPSYGLNVDLEASQKMWAAETDDAQKQSSQEPSPSDEQTFKLICLAVAPAFAAKFGSSDPTTACQDTVKFAKALLEEMKNAL